MDNNNQQKSPAYNRTVRIWTLLSKQQGGRLLAEESQELEALSRGPEGQQALAEYARLEAYWQRLAATDSNEKDIAAFWQLQQEKLKQTGALSTDQLLQEADAAVVSDSVYRDVEPTSGGRLWYRNGGRWMAAAAVVLLALGLFYFFNSRDLRKGEGHQTIIAVQNGDQKQVVLPDGTKVWLNSGSELSYEPGFADAKVKEITLKGEAFFDIEHDADRTFIIHTRYLDIKDLGTRFNVKAYEDEDQMETSLLNGSVEVYPRDHPEQMIRLQPNEKIVISTKAVREGKFAKAQAEVSGKLKLDPAQQSTVSEDADEVAGESGVYIAHLTPKIQSGGDSIVLETAWMQHQLAFSAQLFSDLARNMERWYDVQIDISNPVVRNYIFSGIFKDENLQEALTELQMIQPFEFDIQGRRVRIY